MLRGRAGAHALVPPADPVGLTPLIEVGDAVPLVRHMLRSRTNASANRAELRWALSPAWHPPQTNASCLTLPEASSGAGCASCNDRRVTLGLLYFDEPEVLRSQLANWATWPPAVQRRFDFVVVDDCSQRQRSAAGVLSHSLIDGMPDVRVLTILPPKRAWNIGGGRNLVQPPAEDPRTQGSNIPVRAPPHFDISYPCSAELRSGHFLGPMYLEPQIKG